MVEELISFHWSILRADKLGVKQEDFGFEEDNEATYSNSQSETPKSAHEYGGASSPRASGVVRQMRAEASFVSDGF